MRACSDPQNASAADDTFGSAEREEQDLIKELEAKQLKWAEIPFTNVQEELDAVDQYVKEEEVGEDDPWPKFLRGAAYEHWGQPQLALAQYAKTNQAGALRRIPELWERRGYNAFKMGKVAAAHSYYEIGLSLFYESAGNELHIVHWFYENFEGNIPKWNGPAAPIQRGICKYCFGNPKEARESFMPQIATVEKDTQHALLWFLASCMKLSPNGVLAPRDDKVVRDALQEKFSWSDRMKLFFKLYYAAARGVVGEVSDAENELAEAVKADESDDIATHLYLALYHDAITKDDVEKDRVLDILGAIGDSPSTHDTENFLFHTAKNRLSVPRDGANPEIPEQRPVV